MEEAEALCDRIGVLADGCLQCIASPREVTLFCHILTCMLINLFYNFLLHFAFF